MQIYDTPPPKVPMIPVEMDDEEWAALEKYLVDEHDSALKARKPLEDEWDANIKQWNARMDRPDMVQRPADSNIDMQTTFKYGRVEAAKVLTELFRDPGSLFMCKKVTKRTDIEVQDYQDITDWIEQRSKYLKVGIEDTRDGQVFGMCIDKVGWERNCETVVQPMSHNDPKQLAELNVGIANHTHRPLARYDKVGQTIVEKTIVVSEGAWPRRVAPQAYIRPQYCSDHDTLPWQTHRTWKTKDEMERTAMEGKFPAEHDDAHPDRASMEDLGDPEVTRPTRWDVSYKKTATTENSDSPRHYEFCETWLDRKVTDSDYPVKIVAYFERSKGKLLSVWYNWLAESRDPFHVWCREPKDDSLCGTSLCFRLKYLHQARSGAVNIRFDAARRSASTVIFMDAGASDLTRAFPGNILQDGIYPTTADLDKGIKQFQLSYSGDLLKEFDEVFDAEAAMVVGQNDADMGKDVAQRPTLGGTMKIMEQATLPVDLMRESYSEHLAGLMAAQMARYKQFMPDGIQMFVNMAQDARAKQIDAKLKEWPEGAIAENVVIATRVTNKTINRDVEKQEKFALVKSLPEMINTFMQMAQGAVPVLPNGQPNPLAQVAMDALTNFASATDDMLVLFKVPPNVRFVPLVAALTLSIKEAKDGIAAQLNNAQGQLAQQGNAMVALKQQVVALQAGLQQAGLQNFHLERANRGLSPGSESAVLGQGAALAPGVGTDVGVGAPGGAPVGPMG